MRKVLAVLLTAAILASFCACQPDASKTESSETMSIDDNGVITKTLSVAKLDTHIKGTKVRDREVKDGTRMLINVDNPLFLFRPAQPFNSLNSYFATYDALPDDLKAFSAICVDKGISSSIDELLKTYEDILNRADKENIPVFLMTEVWDSVNTRQGFTEEQLCDLLERHPSLMGFVHVELSCNPLSQEQIDRMKTTIKACKEYGALFIWQEMEYKWENHTNTFNRAFEDEELYQLMTEYSHNIVIQDKHNGRGRHFSVQSSAMGAWLAGVCDNWGGNIEGWIWQEIPPNDYEESSVEIHQNSMSNRYPSSLSGVDLFCDAIGGATVFSTEELNMFYTSTADGIKFTEVFWSVVYPTFQRIINGSIPEKEEVIKNIKVAYQFTSPEDIYMQDIESNLFIDTYGMNSQWFKLWQGGENSKKWLPITGRYYIIPLLPKYTDASTLLPNVDILNVDNYEELFGSSKKRLAYLNERYPETYTGDATLFSINGLTYIFNNCEFVQKVETADYSLKTSGLALSATLDLHTYMILEDNTDSVDIELVNLRLDTYDVSVGNESDGQFRNSIVKGKKMDKEKDRRTTKIALTGFEVIPEVKVSGNNNPTAEVEFDPNTKTATITIVSNGKVIISVAK